MSVLIFCDFCGAYDLLKSKSHINFKINGDIMQETSNGMSKF